MKNIKLKEIEIRAILSYLEYFLEANANKKTMGIRGGRISIKKMEELFDKLTNKKDS